MGELRGGCPNPYRCGDLRGDTVPYLLLAPSEGVAVRAMGLCDRTGDGRAGGEISVTRLLGAGDRLFSINTLLVDGPCASAV